MLRRWNYVYGGPQTHDLLGIFPNALRCVQKVAHWLWPWLIDLIPIWKSQGENILPNLGWKIGQGWHD